MEKIRCQKIKKATIPTVGECTYRYKIRNGLHRVIDGLWIIQGQNRLLPPTPSRHAGSRLWAAVLCEGGLFFAVTDGAAGAHQARTRGGAAGDALGGGLIGRQPSYRSSLGGTAK